MYQAVHIVPVRVSFVQEMSDLPSLCFWGRNNKMRLKKLHKIQEDGGGSLGLGKLGENCLVKIFVVM